MSGSSANRLGNQKNRITSYNVCYTKLLRSVMFVFGVAGDLRTRAQIGDDSEFNSTVLMEATSADSTIMQNKSLHPLYWSYLYISSPLANFQNTIDTFQNRTYSSFENKIFFLLYEMVPDILTVITSYSIHYTKLYDQGFGDTDSTTASLGCGKCLGNP